VLAVSVDRCPVLGCHGDLTTGSQVVCSGCWGKVSREVKKRYYRARWKAEHGLDKDRLEGAERAVVEAVGR